MTYPEFVEIINMPSVLVIMACLTFLITLGVFVLYHKIRG